MGSLRLAVLNIKKNIANAKELKLSFMITIFGMAINNISFLIIWYYFGKTVGIINGWKPLDIFGLYGFSTTAYGIISSVFAGIFDIPTYITNATLDNFLLTPKNILLKISTSKVRTSAFGDLLFGIICFIVFTVSNKFTFIQYLLSLLLIIIVSIVFYSFSLFSMTVSFYLMDGHNVSNGLYGIFVSNSIYHGGAFTGILRLVFIILVPSLVVGALPVELVKDFSLMKLLVIGLIAIFWGVISVSFFYKSLKRYDSNSLFGFGS